MNNIVWKYLEDPVSYAGTKFINSVADVVDSRTVERNLIPLLNSQENSVVEDILWIMSEQRKLSLNSTKAAIRFLSRGTWKQKFFAIDIALSKNEHINFTDYVTIYNLLNDDDSRVRWKAMKFFSRIRPICLDDNAKNLDDVSEALKSMRFVFSDTTNDDFGPPLHLKVDGRTGEFLYAIRLFRVNASRERMLACMNQFRHDEAASFLKDFV